MAKEERIIIQNFQEGIAQSPHIGFGDMRNLDIHSVPGVLRLNYASVKKSSTTVTALIKWFRRNPRNSDQIWGVDDSGKVYRSSDSGASWTHISGNTAGGTGQGLEIWEDYLIVPRATAIDVYGPLSSSPSWTNSWGSLSIDSDTAHHPMLVSKNDGKLYGGAANYIFSVAAVGTFDPANSSTYTATVRHLDLPKNYKIKCLTELGEKLMIGTWSGTSLTDFMIADIFPWDRSASSYETPIQLNAHGVNAMITDGSLIVGLCGTQGQIFVCNGVQASIITQLPKSVVSMIDAGNWIQNHPGAIMKHKGRVFFGVSTGGGATGGCGIWSFKQTPRGYVLTLENIISTGNDGSVNNLSIGALLPISAEVYVSGWRDNSTYGIDQTPDVNFYRSTGYVAYFETALYQIGTNLEKQMLEQMEFFLARAMTSNHGIRIKYRTKLSDSFTTVDTFDFSLGAVVSHNFVPKVPADAEFVQWRVELTTAADNITTPELRSLIVK